MLTGQVRSLAEKLAAERAAKRVRGVHAVANELRVEVISGHVRDDVDIAKAVQNALRWNVSVPDDRIKIAVSKGWVSLEGDVPYGYQRRAAEAAVEHLVGVVGVTNSIVVRPPVSPGDVRRQLNAALHRYAQLEAQQVQVETSGGKVVLTGRVRSWHERQLAEDAAWAAPGVTNVDNRIDVYP